MLTAWGAYGEKTMYGKTVQGVIRSTFVVDEKGKIEVAQYNVKATGHVAKLRRDLTSEPSRVRPRCRGCAFDRGHRTAAAAVVPQDRRPECEP